MSEQDNKSNKPSVPDAVGSQDTFDLEKLRLPQNFADTVGVKRRIVSLSVRKPNRQEFVRVRPGQEWRLETAILIEKSERDVSYLVAPELWSELTAEPQCDKQHFGGMIRQRIAP